MSENFNDVIAARETFHKAVDERKRLVALRDKAVADANDGADAEHKAFEALNAALINHDLPQRSSW